MEATGKSSSRSNLSGGEKIIWLLLTTVFAVLPMIVYFGWVERNLDFGRVYPSPIEPYLSPIVPEFPLVLFTSWSLKMKIVWNFSLVTVWGIIHSLFAQQQTHVILSNAFPPPLLRTIYVMITGAASWIVMSLWQPLDYVVWNLIPNVELSNWINFLITFFFISCQIAILSTFDLLEFFGISHILYGVKPETRTNGTKELITSGIYGIVRHPLYLFLMLSFWVTPLMTLDRFVFALTNVIFLIWAIPIEEIKLEKEFGPSYLEYKKKVPSVIPFSYY